MCVYGCVDRVIELVRFVKYTLRACIPRFVSLIVSKKKHVIIGATVVSARAGEAISELSVAIANKLTMKQVASAMHPYPAFNCAIQFIAAEYAINDLLFHTTTGRWLRSRYGSDQSEK